MSTKTSCNTKSCLFNRWYNFEYYVKEANTQQCSQYEINLCVPLGFIQCQNTETKLRMVHILLITYHGNPLSVYWATLNPNIESWSPLCINKRSKSMLKLSTYWHSDNTKTNMNSIMLHWSLTHIKFKYFIFNTILIHKKLTISLCAYQIHVRSQNRHLLQTHTKRRKILKSQGWFFFFYIVQDYFFLLNTLLNIMVFHILISETYS